MAWAWDGTRGTATITGEVTGGAVTPELDNELRAESYSVEYGGVFMDAERDVIAVDFLSPPSAGDKASVVATVLAHTAQPYVPEVVQTSSDRLDAIEARLGPEE